MRNRKHVSILALTIVAGLGLAIDLFRFVSPKGEKLLPSIYPAMNDFRPAYEGARILMHGHNPYPTPEASPWFYERPKVSIPNVWVVYPFGHLLAMTPIALLFGGNGDRAACAWLILNFLMLFALARVTLDIADCASDEQSLPRLSEDPRWMPLLTAAFALSFGGKLALERGQSEILVSLLYWLSVRYALRRHPSSLLFALLAFSVKYYAFPLLIIYFWLASPKHSRGDWIKLALISALLLSGFFFFRHSLYETVVRRVLHFQSNWLNVSFWNLLPGLSHRFTWIPAAIGVALGGKILFVGIRHLVRSDPHQPVRVLPLLLVVQALAHWQAGLMPLTFPYAAVCLYPGLFILTHVYQRHLVKGWQGVLLLSLATAPLVIPLRGLGYASVCGWAAFVWLAYLSWCSSQMLALEFQPKRSASRLPSVRKSA